MKDKLVALAFLVKCFFYISSRIVRGRTWNMLTVDLENPEGRQAIRYRRNGTGRYSLETWTV